MYTMGCLVPAEVRKEHQNPWNWGSRRRLSHLVGTGNPTQVLCNSSSEVLSRLSSTYRRCPTELNAERTRSRPPTVTIQSSSVCKALISDHSLCRLQTQSFQTWSTDKELLQFSLFKAIRKYRPGLPFPTSFITATFVLDLNSAGPYLESVTHSPAAFPGPVCFEPPDLHAQWETLSHTVPKRPCSIENLLTFIINAKSFPAASLSTVKGCYNHL